MDNNYTTTWFEESLKDSSRISKSKFPSKKSRPIDKNDLTNAVAQADENDRQIMDQFVENEKSKRKLKPKILNWVCGFAAFQLLVMNFILLVVIVGLVIGDGSLLFIRAIDKDALSETFGFLKFYISATVVELLGMLYFMIRKVFDNSIVDLFKLNKNPEDDHKRNLKNYK